MILSTIFIFFQINQVHNTCQDIGFMQVTKSLKPTTSQCDNTMSFNLTFIDQPLQIEIVKQENTISTVAQISTLLASNMNGTIIGYSASSFEFSSPSEHKIDGVNYDMEMQIFHSVNDGSNSTNQIAIVSILFQIDKKLSQPFFDDYYFKVLKHQNTTTLTINFHNSLGVQLSQNPSFYTYENQYCDQNTQWFVLDTPLPISKAQVEHFKFYFNKNQTKGSKTEIVDQEISLVKIKGKYCDSHLLRDIGLFIGYCAVIFLIYRSI